MEFKSKAPVFDVAVALFSNIFFLLSVFVRIFYEVNTEMMTLILFVCGIGCDWYVIKRPTYIFNEFGIKINEPRPFKSAFIEYKDIVAYDIKGNFQSIKAKASGELILTYYNNDKQKYKNIVCMPVDVYGFAEALKKFSGKKFDNND